jgi:hypothetical protein
MLLHLQCKKIICQSGRYNQKYISDIPEHVKDVAGSEKQYPSVFMWHQVIKHYYERQKDYKLNGIKKHEVLCSA